MYMYIHLQYISTLVYYSGCVLSAGCEASVIGDHMCSVGSGLQYQCLSPRVPVVADTRQRRQSGTLTCGHNYICTCMYSVDTEYMYTCAVHIHV